uniref:Uncharacterized protein n=1 Tax=Rhizophora mucronata TaxID=61149 RepID=A0A2P2PGC1_RHIMU
MIPNLRVHLTWSLQCFKYRKQFTTITFPC